jgi:putative colanic acid biosynthesis UDP-glucose lipid carrier transferase
MNNMDLPAAYLRTLPPQSIRVRNAQPRAGSDSAAATLVNSLLHPLLAAATLIACAYVHDGRLTDNYMVLAVLTFLICYQVLGKLDILAPWSSFHRTRLIRSVLTGWGAVCAILATIGFATHFTGSFDKQVIVSWFAAAPLVLLIGTKITRLLAYRAISNVAVARSAVIVGANELGREFAERFRRNSFLGVTVRGYFDDRGASRLKGLDGADILGKVKDAPGYVKRLGIDHVYIALPIAAQPRIIGLINELRDSTASVYFVPHLFDFNPIQARVDAVNGIPVVAVCETPVYGVNAILKRMFDVVAASLILFLIWPLLLVIALAIKLDSRGPVLFEQWRYGLGGDRIVVYKFRTMRVMENGNTIVQASKDDKRITRLGAFLRRMSLDELPQLFNVLDGSMSLVGPRPHAVAHNEQYRKLIDGYMIRHKVKPGITGWAQVNGFRGETQTIDKMQMRIEYDLDYLRYWSFSLDMWIMLKTVFTVWRDRNAY